MTSSSYLNKALTLLKDADNANDNETKFKKNKLVLDYFQMALKCN